MLLRIMTLTLTLLLMTDDDDDDDNHSDVHYGFVSQFCVLHSLSLGIAKCAFRYSEMSKLQP